MPTRTPTVVSRPYNPVDHSQLQAGNSCSHFASTGFGAAAPDPQFRARRHTYRIKFKVEHLAVQALAPLLFLPPRFCLVPRNTGLGLPLPRSFSARARSPEISGGGARLACARLCTQGDIRRPPVLLIFKSSSLPGPGRLPCWNRMRSYLSQCNLPCGFSKCSAVSRHSSAPHAPLRCIFPEETE